MYKSNFIKKNLTSKIFTIFSVLILSSFCACSIFNSSGNNIENMSADKSVNAEQNLANNTNQAQDNLNNVLKYEGANLNSNISDVEILWLIPSEPTEGFVLSYGFNENDLSNKVRLLSNELTEITDPVYNKVYRYVLRNIPKDKVVYLQLVAFNGNNYSQPSKIFTLRAN